MKKEILRIQRKKKDYWDEYEEYNLDSSLDESDCDKLSLDSLSSDDKKEVMIEDSRKAEGTHEDLWDDEEGIVLDDNKSILKLRWQKDAGGYLWGVRRYDSPATENLDLRHRKELEKSAS